MPQGVHRLGYLVLVFPDGMVVNQGFNPLMVIVLHFIEKPGGIIAIIHIAPHGVSYTGQVIDAVCIGIVVCNDPVFKIPHCLNESGGSIVCNVVGSANRIGDGLHFAIGIYVYCHLIGISVFHPYKPAAGVKSIPVLILGCQDKGIVRVFYQGTPVILRFIGASILSKSLSAFP